MKKVIQVAVILFFILLWLFLIWYTQFYIPKVQIVFTENNETLINPSRGFYVQFDSEDVEGMSELRQEGITLALVGFDIRDYVDREISNDKLAELQTVFETAQKNGIKVIFRAAYGFDSEFEYKDSSDLKMVFNHIDQIAPILNKYKQNLLNVQAGFLGPWGEWHSSNLLAGDEAQMTETRNALLEKLLDTLDESIIINVRRPRFLRDAIAAGMDLNRLGVHNDALLSTEDDMGTYDDPSYTRTEELQWLESNVSKSIHGGEMPQISGFSVAEEAIKEFQQMNITYLNHRYNKDVINTWMTTTINSVNAYDEINNHLGYRLFIKTAGVPKYIRKNSYFKFEIELNNSGYAVIPEGYTISLVVRNQNKVKLYPMNKFLIQEIEGGSATSYQYKFDISSEILIGRIDVGFKISELELEAIPNDLNSVILANEGIRYEDGVNYIATYEPEENGFSLTSNP